MFCCAFCCALIVKAGLSESRITPKSVGYSSLDPLESHIRGRYIGITFVEDTAGISCGHLKCVQLYFQEHSMNRWSFPFLVTELAPLPSTQFPRVGWTPPEESARNPRYLKPPGSHQGIPSCARVALRDPGSDRALARRAYPSLTPGTLHWDQVPKRWIVDSTSRISQVIFIFSWSVLNRDHQTTVSNYLSLFFLRVL